MWRLMMRTFYFVCLSAIFIFSPYLKGLYFEKDVYGISIIIGMLFLVLLLRLFVRKEMTVTWKLNVVFILPLLYMISFFYAESPMGSLNLSVRWITYVTFFILLFWSTYSEKKLHKWLPVVFQFMGIWIAFHMFLNVIGWSEFPSAFILKRFAGVIQYPNTFGTIMAVYFLFSVIMLLKEKLNTYEVILYSAPLTLYFYMFVGSLSRGMFVIFPFMVILVLLLVNVRQQLQFIMIGIISAGLSFLLLLEYGAVLYLSVLLLLSAITVMGTYYVRAIKLPVWLKNWSMKKVTNFMLPLLIVIFGSLLFMDIYFQGMVFKALPSNVQDKVESLNDSATFRERILFLEDGLEVSQVAPIFGHGGQGWSVLYRDYQQTPYQSKKVHNGFLELLIDLGWFGFSVFIITFGSLLYFVIQNYRKGLNKPLHLAVLVSLLAIFLHSLIDFDFGFGTTWLIIFWLFGISLASEHVFIFSKAPRKLGKASIIQEKNKNVVQKLANYPIYLFGILVIISTVFSFLFMQAHQAYSQVKAAPTLAEKEQHLSVATKKNKWHRKYLYELADVKIQLKRDKAEIVTLTEAIAALEPTSSIAQDMAGRLAEKIGDDKQALVYYRGGIKKDVFHHKLYAKTMTLLLDQQSEESVKMVIKLYEDVEQTYQVFLKNPIAAYHNSRNFDLTDDILLHASIAYYLSNQPNKMLALMNHATKEQTKIDLTAIYSLRIDDVKQESLHAFYEKNRDAVNVAKEQWQDKLRNYRME